MDKETRELLDKTKKSNDCISVADLAKRFEEIDEYYNYEFWSYLYQLKLINESRV